MIHKLKILAILSVIAAALGACNDSARTELQQLVDSNRGSYPISVGAGMQIDSIYYSDNCVTYDVSVGYALPIAQLKERQAEVDSLITDAITHTDDERVQAELEACRRAGATLKVVLTNTQGDAMQIMVDPADSHRQ